MRVKRIKNVYGENNSLCLGAIKWDKSYSNHNYSLANNYGLYLPLNYSMRTVGSKENSFAICNGRKRRISKLY